MDIKSANTEGTGWIDVNKRKEVMPVVGFDPAQCYLKELRVGFGHLALFFYNAYGGSVIGVVWRPEACRRTDFKVRGGLENS